jgi:hypothetical protein
MTIVAELSPPELAFVVKARFLALLTRHVKSAGRDARAELWNGPRPELWVGGGLLRVRLRGSRAPYRIELSRHDGGGAESLWVGRCPSEAACALVLAWLEGRISADLAFERGWS